jgi:hypothetical protein
MLIYYLEKKGKYRMFKSVREKYIYIYAYGILQMPGGPQFAGLSNNGTDFQWDFNRSP